ncbi:unnamed protein product [Trichobilharzia szidati]|nr:unnamed protein product [Trichobilharzia szidati]
MFLGQLLLSEQHNSHQVKKSSVLITDLGKWVGVILDEPKGKNNGTVQGKRYFTCEENFGIFVRPSQLTLLDGPEGSSVMELSTCSVVSESGATSESSEVAKLSGSTSSLSVGLKTAETVKGRTSKLPGLKRSPLASSTSSVKDKASVPASAGRIPSEIKKTSQEKAEVKEAFDRYREEVTEMVENIEMATLDKEMAEEKLETLTAEIELLKEQVEELTLENQILKEESEEKGDKLLDTAFVVTYCILRCYLSFSVLWKIPGGVAVGVEGGPTPLQFKNLEQQNERMKEALVKLRDLVNQDKSEISALTKQITSLESEVSQLQTEKERLTKDVKDSVEQIIELKEQVDASLGIDTMVSQLTQRNLELEEALEKIKEERNDLEALCEMNDELQENSRETELELREEIERCNSKINQLVRNLDATRETIADYEQTFVKFRDLVSDLQTQNTDLRRSLADGKRLQEEKQQQNAYPTVATDLVGSTAAFMGGKFGLGSQVQTLAKVIEAELRRLEAEQTANHVTRLSAFLPDSFLRRGGDNEALLSLLLIDRLAGKCDLLANHLVERYPLPPCVPGQAPLQMPQGETSTTTTATTTDNPTEVVSGICIPGTNNPLPPLTKTKSEFFSFITRLIHLLRSMSSLLGQCKQEYEQTLDALQADIEALEQEKAELKEKLKTLSKKALFEGIIKTPLVTGQTPSKGQTATPETPSVGKQTSVEGASPSPGPARLAAYRDASFMSMEIAALREAVRRLSSEVSKLRGEKMFNQMKSLGTLPKPIRRQYLKAVDNNTANNESQPSSTTEEKEEVEKEQKPMISQVAREADALRKEMFSVIANLQIVRLPKPSKPIEEPPSGAGDGSTQQQQSAKAIVPTPTMQFNRQTAQLVKLKNDLEKLQQRAVEAVKTEIPGASIQADFTSFPSVKLKRLFNAENNENLPLRSRLVFPGGDDCKMNPTKVCMTREDQQILHSHLLK